MTVRELIVELLKMDLDALAVVSQDEEGNGFGPLVEVSGPGWWAKSEQEYFDDEDEGYDAEALAPDGEHVKAVCLWP